jgi:hypothetical protein
MYRFLVSLTSLLYTSSLVLCFIAGAGHDFWASPMRTSTAIDPCLVATMARNLPITLSVTPLLLPQP